jgi:hypothetical protein
MKINSLSGQDPIRRTPAMFVAFFVLCLGFLYYALFRDHSFLGHIPGFLEHRLLLTQWMLIGFEIQWLPSYLHALATLLCVHALVASNNTLNKMICRVTVVSSLIAFELLFGIVDKFDIIAIVVAGFCAELFVIILRSKHSCIAPQRGVKAGGYNRFSLLGIVGLSGLLAAGSYYDGSYEECAQYDGGGCVEYKRPAAPVYMSYQRLRESVQIEAARPPDRLGRVYLYENYILLNEQNEGVHIIDNTDPALPVNLGFIRIPGNTDLAMRDNYLFADSYVDLITLDMNDSTNIQVVNRQVNLFPYDAFQNIPYNVSFRQYEINAELGVVVSYQLSGN